MSQLPSLLTLSAILFTSAVVCCDGATFRNRHRSLRTPSSGSNQTCVPLHNRGTHSTVEVAVGTPGQFFSVVADTGSNSLIVPSCICRQAGYCSATDRCFVGTNQSSTFSIEGGPNDPTGVMVSFGSGMIKAVIAHDMVHVGNLEHQMQDGLLLMTAHALAFPGAFEGILGLGPPMPPAEVFAPTNSSDNNQENADGLIPFNQIKKIVQKIMGGSDMGDGIINDFPDDFDQLPGLFNRIQNQSKPDQSSVTGFLEQAKIEYFSMCFNDGADGVLRLGTPESNKETFQSVGTEHWGLDFRGISVGNMSARLSFCQETNLTESQKTPCGAIPDSGTTAIMAPKEHAAMLFETICDQWQRCADNYTALVRAGEAAKKAAMDNYNVDPFDISVTESSKKDVLSMLLFDCENWMNESNGFEELPSLKFHVRGDDGTSKTLEIPGVSYILQSNIADLEHVANESNVSMDTVKKSVMGHKQVVCSPAIGDFEYNTEENGPVWILGTPFFYEYNVGYNMFEKTISFTSTKEEACGSCSHDLGFVSTGRSAHKLRQPRVARWPRRMPSIDVTKPL